MCFLRHAWYDCSTNHPSVDYLRSRAANSVSPTTSLWWLLMLVLTLYVDADALDVALSVLPNQTLRVSLTNGCGTVCVSICVASCYIFVTFQRSSDLIGMQFWHSWTRGKVLCAPHSQTVRTGGKGSLQTATWVVTPQITMRLGWQQSGCQKLAGIFVWLESPRNSK